MRVAVIIVLTSLLSTPSEASQPCMTKTEARQHFGSVHIYWHGEDHCWDATPTRRHHQIHKVQQKIDQPKIARPKIDQPKWHESMSEMMPDEEPVQNTMGRSLGRYRATTDPHCRALGRYRSGRAGAHHRKQTCAHGHAAHRGDGDHHHRTDACDCRTSVRRHEIG